MSEPIRLLNRKGFNWVALGFFGLVIATFLSAIAPFYYSILTSFESGQQLVETNYLPQIPKQDQYNIFIRSNYKDFQNICDGRKCSDTAIEDYIQNLTTIQKIGLTNKVIWKNYVAVFTKNKFYVNFGNSIRVATVAVILSLSLGATAAFALGRIKFKGRGTIMLILLSISTFPQVAVLSGMYQMINYLDTQTGGVIGFNTWPALVVSYMIFTLPFTIWILTTFVRDIPIELEEAAIMDGANPLQTLTKIFLPLLWPAMVTTGLLAFIGAWNEYLFAASFMQTNDVKTLTPAIADLNSGTSNFEEPAGLIMAASVSVTIPLIILVLIFQRKIVSGLTGGAVKG